MPMGCFSSLKEKRVPVLSGAATTWISDGLEYWDPGVAERSPLKSLGPRLASDTLRVSKFKGGAIVRSLQTVLCSLQNTIS